MLPIRLVHKPVTANQSSVTATRTIPNAAEVAANLQRLENVASPPKENTYS